MTTRIEAPHTIPNRAGTGVHPLRMIDPMVFDARETRAVADYFRKNGYAVVDSVSKPEQRDRVIRIMDALAHNPQARRLGFMDLYHDDSLAQLRQNPCLYHVFAQIYGTHKLWSVFDRVMYWRTTEGEQPLPPHVDQNPIVDPDFGHIQAMLALRPMNEGTGTLALVPRSSHVFSDYAPWTAPHAGFVEYQGDAPLDFVGLRLAAGQIVLWDSRTTHSRYRGDPTDDRYAALITYKPAIDDSALRQLRLDRFADGLGANHHAAGLRATAPPRYDQSARQTPEQLTPLGQRLYGLSSWFTGTNLLLNAEAFGYGPAAAMSQLAEGVRGQVDTLGYIGSGHTLHLQNVEVYDEIVPVADPDGAELGHSLSALHGKYTHFFTACDFRAARLAHDIGFQVGIFDPLTWFWRTPPPSARLAQLYIAQDFFGVSERLATRPEAYPSPSTYIIPPLVQGPQDRPIDAQRCGVLINLGGLSNTFASDAKLSRFANIVARDCRLIAGDQTVSIAANRHIVGSASDHQPTLGTPSAVYASLKEVRLAFMTSGLGNLTEASAAATPTVWLPPANDSQGQQMALLRQRGMVEGWVDWHAFTDGPPVDYFKPQAEVMASIEQRMTDLVSNSGCQARFLAALRKEAGDALDKRGTPAIAGLVDRFGQGGLRNMAELVVSWVQ